MVYNVNKSHFSKVVFELVQLVHFLFSFWGGSIMYVIFRVQKIKVNLKIKFSGEKMKSMVLKQYI